MTTAEINWAAGYFEGEGCIHGNRMQLELANTDLDALQKFHSIVKVGWIAGPLKKPKHPNHKPCWCWYVTGRDAAALLMTMFTLLGKRRQERARQTLIRWKNADARSGYSRLTYSQIKDIQSRQGLESQYVTAEKFGISQVQVSRIQRGIGRIACDALKLSGIQS